MPNQALAEARHPSDCQRQLDSHFARKQGRETRVISLGVSEENIIEFQIVCLLLKIIITMVLYHMTLSANSRL